MNDTAILIKSEGEVIPRLLFWTPIAIMKLLSVLLAVFLVLFAVSCGGPAPHPPTHLVIGINSDPQNLDPRFGLDAASLRCYQLMYNGLVRLDEHSRLKPDLADSIRIENSREYVADLRKNVLFHNGKEMTSRDVKYTYDSILDGDNASPLRQSFKVIREIKVEGDYRVRFILKHPHAPFLGDLTQPIIVEPHEQEKPPGPPPGTGPFRLETYRPGEYISLKAHTRCYKGSPFMEKVVLKITPDDTTRFLQLKRGDLDFVQNGLIPEVIPLLEKDSRFKILRGKGSNYAYLGFNMKDPVLRRHKVRAAIAHALNVPEMITYLMGGHAIRATGILYPGNWAYERDVKTYDYDPDRARRLLDEAGFTNRPVRFTLSYKTSQTDVGLRKAQYVQAQLQKIGIKVEIRSYEWSTFFADIRNSNFQLYSLEWVGISDPDIFYHVFHSGSVPPGGANRGGYVNTRLDNLLEMGRRETDLSRRATLYSRVQKIVARDLPYVSLWHPQNIAVMKSDLEGYTIYPSGDISSLCRVRRAAAGSKNLPP